MKSAEAFKIYQNEESGRRQLTQSLWAGQDRAEPAIVENIWAQTEKIFDFKSRNFI